MRQPSRKIQSLTFTRAHFRSYVNRYQLADGRRIICTSNFFEGWYSVSYARVSPRLTHSSTSRTCMCRHRLPSTSNFIFSIHVPTSSKGPSLVALICRSRQTKLFGNWAGGQGIFPSRVILLMGNTVNSSIVYTSKG